MAVCVATGPGRCCHRRRRLHHHHRRLPTTTTTTTAPPPPPASAVCRQAKIGPTGVGGRENRAAPP